MVTQKQGFLCGFDQTFVDHSLSLPINSTVQFIYIYFTLSKYIFDVTSEIKTYCHLISLEQAIFMTKYEHPADEC